MKCSAAAPAPHAMVAMKDEHRVAVGAGEGIALDLLG